MLEIDIYGAGLCFPEFEKQFEAIEAALGFKLFAWQKTYIVHGQFRRYGATTAEILRELMQVEAFPLDYTKKPKTQREAIERKWRGWQERSRISRKKAARYTAGTCLRLRNLWSRWRRCRRSSRKSYLSSYRDT